ncbi:MAG: hypothetical protein CM1200mP26_27080 [Acidimicrobiales bacterium]|nr:MAG: hypothetical protein CM1200mP26_27080 [Acidimicrobiales bacterium]
MTGDGLLGVQQEHRVEAPEVGGTATTHHYTLGGEGPLGDPVRVLGGEFQLEACGVGDAGTDAQRVDQTLLGGPRDLSRFADRSDGVWVDGHGGSPGLVVPSTRW